MVRTFDLRYMRTEHAISVTINVSVINMTKNCHFVPHFFPLSLLVCLKNLEKSKYLQISVYICLLNCTTQLMQASLNNKSAKNEYYKRDLPKTLH